MVSVSRQPTEDDRLSELALERCEKILNSVDRFVARAWADGYKYALTERGLITESAPIPQKRTPAAPVYNEPEPVKTYEVPTESLPQGWRKVYHNRGEYPCGKAALLVTRPVYADEAASLELLRFVNGQKVTVQDTPNCGGCGRLIHPWSNADLDWSPHKLPVRQQYTMSFGDFQANQIEPGMDQPVTSADPTVTRSPSSVLADLRDAVQKPYTDDDDDLSMIGSADEEIEAIEELYKGIGLSPPQSPPPSLRES